MYNFLKSRYFKTLVVTTFLFLIVAIVFYRLGIVSENFKEESEVPAMTDKNSIHFLEAPDNIGRKVWVEGEIDHVFMSVKGNYFLNFCSDFRYCPFNSLIFSDQAYLFNDINSWSGDTVYIYGLIEVYENRPQIIIKNPNQIKFKSRKKPTENIEDIYVGKKSVEVVNVIDGDTIWVKLEGKVESVRLIGIDAPEIKGSYSEEQCFGRESYDYLKDILDEEVIIIESRNISLDRDKYNRLLRYVYLSDGTLLNEHLIEEGYAFAYPFEDYSERDNFLILEEKAKENRVGLWSEKCDYYTEK